ncbi:hypothetical protein DRQ25_14820 [Candidatus Fermentibacteria bacterium]|nr:MAG: hypothetical protein DRQ25_14820 [Candidatus Fermentibacteria bacterium]
MAVVRRNVSITEIQDKFLRERNLSLSKLVQERIEKEIDDWKFARATSKALREMERGHYEEMDLAEFLEKAKKW